MPCFDKKLEASRADFKDEDEVKDVDLVITTLEVEQMIKEDDFNVEDPPQDALDSLTSVKKSLVTSRGSGSGGFAENVLIEVARDLFNMNLDSVDFKILKNADFKETVLLKDGEPVLRFAIANGFRNIQNLVQKMKRKRCDYDFVEIMACPSGCLNGGAQSRLTEDNSGVISSSSSKAMLKDLESLHDAIQKQIPSENREVDLVYSDWLGGRNSDKASHFLYTDYHEVEKMTNSLTIKW